MTTRRSVFFRGFDMGIPPVIVDHEFHASSRGELLHSVNGELRATVPPESFDAYAEAWPACKPVADALRPAPKAKAPAPKRRK